MLGMKGNDQMQQSFGIKSYTGFTMGEKANPVSFKKRYSKPVTEDIINNKTMSIHEPVNINHRKFKHKKSYLEK